VEDTSARIERRGVEYLILVDVSSTVYIVTYKNGRWFRNQRLEHRVSARFYTCIVGTNPTNSTINFPVRASISDAKHSGKSWYPQGSQKVLERP